MWQGNRNRQSLESETAFKTKCFPTYSVSKSTSLASHARKARLQKAASSQVYDSIDSLANRLRDQPLQSLAAISHWFANLKFLPQYNFRDTSPLLFSTVFSFLRISNDGHQHQLGCDFRPKIAASPRGDQKPLKSRSSNVKFAKWTTRRTYSFLNMGCWW